MPTSYREEGPSYVGWNNGGSVVNLDSPNSPVNYSDSVNTRVHSLKDYVTVDDPYPTQYSFDLERYRGMPWASNGIAKKYSWSDRLKHSNFTQSNQRGNTYNGLKSHDVSPDWTYYKNLAVEQSNPNKPITDVGVFIWELKDFPRMLKFFWDLGRKKPSLKDLPEADLMYQFGIRPFISDLNLLMQVGKKIDERYYELRRLLDNGPKRYSRTLLSQDDGIVAQPGDSTSQPNSVTTYRRTRHVSAVWKVNYTGSIPFGPFKPPSGILEFFDDNSEALASLYGFRSAQADTLWNLIPWSWLVDYFSNIGSILEGQRPGLDYRVTQLWLKSLTEVRCQVECTSKSFFHTKPTYKDGKGVYTAKRRRGYNSPTLTLEFEPYLTSRQLNNLGSLALARTFKKRGTNWNYLR